MTLLRRALSYFLPTQQKAVGSDRIPLTASSGLWLTDGGGTSGNRLAQMQAYGNVGWLFATVSRIAQAVASAEWVLERSFAGRDPVKVTSHPLLDLWDDINPYDTRQTFLELTQQHLDLTGEAWWVLVRNGAGIVQEMWAVRPDRMRPVPHRTEFISGYVYTIGAERIPLGLDDVIFLRIPSPLDPYRGMGPVQSLLVDIGGEHSAAQWSRNFYTNSAEPGGIVELAETISDAEFERLRQRWGEQHQGVGNAHRVAFLEHGHWVDRKYTQRDMQYEQLRRLNRDLILGAFGMPLPMLGIVESVNRANAEAADVMFSRWLVRPRLERIKSALNTRLVPMFDPSLRFSFIDPTPDNRELDLTEAERGYKAGLLTRNEGRLLLNQEPVADGDDFAEPQAEPFGGGMASVGKALVQKATAIDVAERHMRAAWAKRLHNEMQALSQHLEQFMSKSPRMKIELADIATYDWDWWRRYGDDVVDELSEVFALVLGRELPTMPIIEAQRLAAEYAQVRGARLLRVDGDLNMVNFTRQRVNQLVAQTIERGDSLQTLQKALREDLAFSRERARIVARTEAATAQGQGAKGAAIAQGRDEKHWVTQGDDAVEGDCLDNEAAGWIDIGAMFPTGVDTIPQHVNCRCNVRYRSTPLIELQTSVQRRALPQIVPELRCPVGHLVARDTVPGANHWCRRCKENVLAVSIETTETKQTTETVHRKQLIKIVERDDLGRIARVIEEIVP